MQWWTNEYIIEKQSKLTGIGIGNIKQRTKNILSLQNNQTDIAVGDVFVEEANNPFKESNEDVVEPSQSPSNDEDLVKDIKRAKAESGWQRNRTETEKLSCWSNKQTRNSTRNSRRGTQPLQHQSATICDCVRDIWKDG